MTLSAIDVSNRLHSSCVTVYITQQLQLVHLRTGYIANFKTRSIYCIQIDHCENCNFYAIYYHPQRSWGKVIFSEVCVKNSVHKGGYMAGKPCVAGGSCVVGGM